MLCPKPENVLRDGSRSGSGKTHDTHAGPSGRSRNGDNRVLKLQGNAFLLSRDQRERFPLTVSGRRVVEVRIGDHGREGRRAGVAQGAVDESVRVAACQ
jgi:hypothetical protein